MSYCDSRKKERRKKNWEIELYGREHRKNGITKNYHSKRKFGRQQKSNVKMWG